MKLATSPNAEGGATGVASGRTARALAARVGDAYLGMVTLVVLELLAVAWLARERFFAAVELGVAAIALLPVALGACVPFALLAGVCLELAARGKNPWCRGALALLAGAAAAGVGLGVSTGRHLAAPAVRGAFVAALALSAALLVGAAAPVAARVLAERRRGQLVAAGAGATALGLLVADRLVLPRLYPAFHDALRALALLAAATAAQGALGRPSTKRLAAALALALATVAASVPAARRLALGDNLRLIYHERGSVLARAVDWAARLAPPPPLEPQEGGEGTPAPHREAAAPSLDLRGRDILLVTIDALRADHVGAYGYSRGTTPHLDALAREGVLFEAAYTATPHTSYAVASLLTGKYMRPLLLQGQGGDSDTLATHARRYGYRTAAFYPPAVFFIDGARFAPLRERALDFEYRKIEFASASQRVEQLRRYLDRADPERRVLAWVHLFEPHEPYEAHPEHPFGDRDLDRYDAEIAAADAALGRLVEAMRARRPGTVVVVTADHGEEFGEHGGRYHGTTVYEEQVRVPLVISAPGALAPRRVAAPVQGIDLVPTLLAALHIPRPARVRGHDLGPYLAGSAAPPGHEEGFAFAETEEHTLLARGRLRLVCARRIGACTLYDLETDPGQRRDASAAHEAAAAQMRRSLRELEASHGRFETAGLRAEGRGWPEPLRRGLAGDGDAAPEIAALLDDADVEIRRKSAEALFELARKETAAALRLSLLRDEDEVVRRWAALAVTRLGEGAALTHELARSRDRTVRRLASLVLAEQGDDRGEDVLVGWWLEGGVPFERARQILDALARIRSKKAVWALADALADPRLGAHVARTLAAIGERSARPSLARQLARERSQSTRVALAEALVQLGAGPELAPPLLRFLGTPDPLPGGLDLALRGDVLRYVGGPRKRDVERLRRFAPSGVPVEIVIPRGGNGKGLRLLVRAGATGGEAGEVRVGRSSPRHLPRRERDRESIVPAVAAKLDPRQSVALAVPVGPPQELVAPLPRELGLEPGDGATLVAYATQNVTVEALAVVPFADEIPPPPPEPWTPSVAESEEGEP